MQANDIIEELKQALNPNRHGLLEQLRNIILNMQDRMESLEHKVTQLNNQIAHMEFEHQNQITRMETRHNAQIAQLNNRIEQLMNPNH